MNTQRVAGLALSLILSLGLAQAVRKPAPSKHSARVLRPMRALPAYDLEATNVAFSPDGTVLATAGQSEAIQVVKQGTQRLRLTGAAYSVKLWDTTRWGLL